MTSRAASFTGLAIVAALIGVVGCAISGQELRT